MDGSINFSGTLAGSIADSGGGKIKDVQTNASGDYESVVDEQGVAKIDLSNYAADEQLESAVDNINSVLLTKQNVVNYSTDEQLTCQKWTDNKNLFIKTFQGQLTISTTNRTWYNLISNLSYMDKVFVMPESYIELSDAIINIPYTTHFNNVGAVVGVNFDTPTSTFQLLIGGLPMGTYNYEITLKYTKSI